MSCEQERSANDFWDHLCLESGPRYYNLAAADEAAGPPCPSADDAEEDFLPALLQEEQCIVEASAADLPPRRRPQLPLNKRASLVFW